MVKKFTPSKEADHDCSVKFKNVLYEEEGLWTCGVRLSTNGILHEAPPATVTLLPSGDYDVILSLVVVGANLIMIIDLLEISIDE